MGSLREQKGPRLANRPASVPPSPDAEERSAPLAGEPSREAISRPRPATVEEPGSTEPGGKADDFVFDLATEDYEGRAVWERHTSLSDATPPTLFERINQAQSVLAILRACLPADKAFEELEKELISAATKVATLNAHEPGTPGYREHASTIARELRHVETQLQERERKVPLSWLRHQADEYDFSESSFAHYLRFQIKYRKETPECWSRIDLVITLLARKRNDDGSFSVRPAEEVAALWSACLPPSETRPAVRKGAIRYFRDALRRLGELDHVEELFATSYYIDVLGFKLSLRSDYFDPPILHAAAELNVAIESWLEAHHGRNMRALDKQFAEAHETVRKIFLRQTQDHEDLVKRWSRSVEPRQPTEDPAQAKKDQARSRKKARSKPLRRFLVPAALILTLALGAPMLVKVMGQRKRDLQPIASAEIHSIHPLLTRASYSGQPPRLLVGELDADRWLALTSAERRAEVDTLLGALQDRGVNSALIYRQRILAVHIIGGQVRFVE